MTLAEALKYAQSQIVSSDSPAVDAQWLLMHVLDCDRSYLFTWPERSLSRAQEKEFKTLVARRAIGEPVAFITGSRAFWNFELEVNNTTLIPRADTEILVETALSLGTNSKAQVLDLGTGTGAIAFALATERPDWQILAVDKFPEAIALAKRNRERLGLNEVEIQQSDWFQSIDSASPFDLIVSNPPYIDSEDLHLEAGDVRFEPKSALVAQSEGYADIFHIIEHARAYLSDSGWLLFEHGYMQAEKIQEYFLEKGYKRVNTVQDYANLNRVTFAQWQFKG
ncbi:MAG: release factor glutamine methyltransferase HemK [Idiomarinaceae bacterium HL-53]|nr:MAG: release factor glutamine methyltransferase HemK [Idiomarinaceae bacterium HL-53]CUS48789.1 [protein release factor]-glutamine N5-methyltransferase [Idiomarinaceae bacterium HL-53]